MYTAIKNHGIIPEIKIERADDAVPLAKALSFAGIDIAEIDFETENAARAVKEISAELPGMFIIAGKVADAKKAAEAAEAGAKAAVLRGRENFLAEGDILAIPECINENEIEAAVKEGYRLIKFIFNDTAKTIEKYPEIQFILCGKNITEDSLADYLSFENAAACGAPFICEEQYIKERKFDKITKKADRAVKKMLGFEFSHLVVNCENSEQAEKYSEKIESIFGLPKKDEGISVSNAGVLHFMKNKSYGRNGQISVSTDFMDRAVFYFKKTKHDLIEESARYGAGGELVSIYLDSIIGGFAFKLVKKN